MTGETEPKPSLEEQVMIKLGYEHCLDTPTTAGQPATGRNFLDAYGDNPHRQITEDKLRTLMATPESDPDYESFKQHILIFLEAQFGPPNPQ